MMNLFDHQKNFINLFFFNLVLSCETICNIIQKRNLRILKPKSNQIKLNDSGKLIN